MTKNITRRLAIVAIAALLARARVPQNALRMGAAYAMGAIAFVWCVERAQLLAFGNAAFELALDFMKPPRKAGAAASKGQPKAD